MMLFWGTLQKEKFDQLTQCTEPKTLTVFTSIMNALHNKCSIHIGYQYFLFFPSRNKLISNFNFCENRITSLF